MRTAQALSLLLLLLAGAPSAAGTALDRKSGPRAEGPSDAPSVPVLVAPANGASNVPAAALLKATVSDPDGDLLDVTFLGRSPTDPVSDFTIVVLPDTQHYTSLANGIFEQQTQWIADNRQSRNIVYVGHLGDCVDEAFVPAEWQLADAAMSTIEDPGATALPEGIPYGMVPGNHDQDPWGAGSLAEQSKTTELYNQYFGIPRFAGRGYYGDHFGTNNDNHYDLFTASGMDFVVVYMEYDTVDSPLRQAVIDWADGVLAAFPSRRAIVISHYILSNQDASPVPFGPQGQAIYDALKDRPNLFLMLSGHLSNERRRTDVFNGSTVHTLLADYQGRPNGGDGWLRILEFSPEHDEIRVHTYSPSLNQFELDSNSEFVLPYPMTGLPDFVPLGTQEDVPSGSTADLTWTGRKAGKSYEWRVVTSDATQGTSGPIWSFTSNGSCSLVSDCDEGNVCTTHACNLNQCTTNGVPGCCNVDTDCDDSNLCTDDACVAHACQHPAVDCDDDNPCTDDTCSPGTGCGHVPDDANPCADAMTCTTADHCYAGDCVGDDSCPTLQSCTAAGCQPLSAEPLPIEFGETWRYFKGKAEPPTQWKTVSFHDSSWAVGPSGFGYGDEDDATLLADMQGQYRTVYIRALFDLADPAAVSGLTLVVDYDDGFVAYINGTEVARSNVSGNPPPYNTSANSSHEAGIPELFPLDAHLPLLVPGINLLAVQGHNNGIGSADFSLIPALYACGDGDACTLDTLDPVAGCLHSPAPAGTTCDDGDPCTGGDSCDASGSCVASPPVDCSDQNSCTTDSCGAGQSCVHSPNTGQSCSDDSACTAGDVCDAAGACAPGSPVDCDDQNPCTTDSCAAGPGCLHAPNTGQSCSDGSVCTVRDSCNAAGTCTPGPPLDCDDQNPCTLDSCDAVQGCLHLPSTGQSCSDGNPCTAGDECDAAGACQPGPPASCDDQNACTTDSCDPVQGCLHSPDTAASCSDGNACTANDHCDAAGVCTGTGSPSCNDLNICTTDSCDPVQGCLHSSNAGASCSDGNACTTADTCNASGACVGGAPLQCDDGKFCTTDSCSPASGCKFEPNVGVACDDGSACTLGETCDGTGNCSGGTPPDCEDGEVCTTDGCDPASGCTHAPAAGASCSDGNACTTGDACDAAGSCASGPPTNCDDQNTCTTDSCDAQQGCLHTPNTGQACNDGSVCTTTDTCKPNGTCSGIPTLLCNDLNPCTVDGCNPQTGCFHAPANCDDGKSCTTDTCSPPLGCAHTPTPGASCASACATGATCDASGACVGGDPVDCDDRNPCTIEVGCDPGTGCLHQADPGASCDDGNSCTSDDVCSAEGVCDGDLAPAPGEVDGLVVHGVSPTTLEWIDPGGGLAYDLVGGLVGELAVDSGVAGAECLADGVVGSSYEDLRSDPAEGTTYYYLVRAATECASGSYGTDSKGKERVPAADCP